MQNKKSQVYFKKNGKFKKINPNFTNYSYLDDCDYSKKGYHKTRFHSKGLIKGISIEIDEDVEEAIFINCNFNYLIELIIKNKNTKVYFHNCLIDDFSQTSVIKGGSLYFTNLTTYNLEIDSESIAFKGVRNKIDPTENTEMKHIKVRAGRITIEGNHILSGCENEIISDKIFLNNCHMDVYGYLYLTGGKVTILNSEITSNNDIDINSKNLIIASSKIHHTDNLNFYYDTFKTEKSTFQSTNEMTFNNMLTFYNKEITSSTLTDPLLIARESLTLNLQRLEERLLECNENTSISITANEALNLANKKRQLENLKREIRELELAYSQKKDFINASLSKKKVKTFKNDLIKVIA